MYVRFFKRLLDILFAVFLLPFALLIIGVAGLMVYREDKGPIFYNAQRMGLKGKPFTMYKLRSMALNAPDIRNEDGSTFNADEDPRLTKIGRVMRKTSVDEVPQVLNVLKGDMSFVGPRPTLVDKPYEQLDAGRKKRLSVRPGITGYSQAFFRNSITQEKKFEHDNIYVDQLSFALDFKVLLKTISSVLKRQNINSKA